MEPFILDRPGDVQTPALFHLSSWEHEFSGLAVGISSRLGGVSKGDHSTLNCALHVGDDPEHVFENRIKMAGVLQFPFSGWTCAEQVHSNRIAVVTSAERGKGRFDRDSAISGTDALITGENGILLTAFFADCVPLYYVDSGRKVIGIAHAGWKGTSLEIARHVIEAFALHFGSEPTEIRTAIGPAIGGCCYEVDQQVIDALPPPLVKYEGMESTVRKLTNGKYMLDLQEFNRQIMIKAGILPSRIELSGLCTSCNLPLLFSHRKERGKTGRMAGWIGWK